MYFTTFLLKNLLRRKVRSLLTAAGVAVAVGTTVALLGISKGFENSTLQSFEMRGVDIVVIEKDVLDQLNSNIDQKFVQRVQQMPEVAKVGPALVNLEAIDIKGNMSPVFVEGWEPGGYLFEHLEIKSGRRLVQDDARVCLLGEAMAQKTEKKPGDTIEITGEPFEVVGVFESGNFHENNAILVPLAAYQEVQVRPGSITGFSVVVNKPPGTDIERVINTVIDKINNLKGEDGRSARLSARTFADYAAQAMHLKMAEAMALMTSTIAVIVGTIGMLNTMIMSVMERVREIATLRAIGWRKSRVMRMIVGESLMLSLVGAVLGVAAAFLITQCLTLLPQVSGLVQPEIAASVIFIGFLMALLVGLVGGTYPAWRATRMQPSEGLRHE
jgi:putative ABC transport system permease protein